MSIRKPAQWQCQQHKPASEFAPFSGGPRTRPCKRWLAHEKPAYQPMPSVRAETRRKSTCDARLTLRRVGGQAPTWGQLARKTFSYRLPYSIEGQSLPNYTCCQRYGCATNGPRGLKEILKEGVDAAFTCAKSRTRNGS